MTIKTATMLVFNSTITQSNPQTKRKKAQINQAQDQKRQHFNSLSKNLLPFVEMAKSSRKIRQSLSTISSKDFLLQWRSSNARCLSWSRCFFIRVLKKKEPRVTFTANGKRKFVPRDQVSPLLVVYCFLYLLKCRASGYVSSLKSEIGLKIRIWILVKKRTFRFFDEDDYEYKIFSILSIGQAWTSVILAGKRDSRRHTRTSFSKEVVVAGRSYQM